MAKTLKLVHVLYAILFILALAVWCLGQDAVVSSTPWQLEVQAQLDAAGKTAAAGNRSIVVSEEPGKYEFVSLDIPPHVFLVFGSGEASREADLIYVGGDNPARPLVTARGGYSGGLAGCQIRDKSNSRPGLVGIRVEDAINPTIRNVRVDLRGKDSIGLQIAGRESLTTCRLESRAAVPVQYIWGDNIALHDCDLGATGNVGQLPNCVLHVAGMPHQITLDGSCTAQGGDHLVWGEVASSVSGQGLHLYNVRWEGSTSTSDFTKAAIHLVFTDRRLENLLVVGSRWTDRRRAFRLLGVTQTTVAGSRLPGTN